MYGLVRYMSAEIRYLTPKPEPIGHFIRIGASHHQLETLHSSGRFRVNRVVAEAASLKAQSGLLGAVRSANAEITLDTRIAELSEPGSFVPSAQWLACADKTRPMIPRDFSGEGSRRVAVEVATFAVTNAIHAVLAPSHFVADARSAWWQIDLQLCEDLRQALDTMGGGDIRIDYSLITSYGTLREPEQRRAFLGGLQNMPFDNLWLRISDFGADATATGVTRCISALADFHALNRPLVADHLGGLAGLAVVAFGATGAIAHGVSEKERFDVRRWLGSRKPGGGGQSGRVYLPALDRYFKIDEARALLEVRGARRLLACADRDCCPRGADDTFNDTKAHFITQRLTQLADLSTTPEARRVSRFLDFHLAFADRQARQAANLDTSNPATKLALQKASLRLDRMRVALENLDQTIGHEHSRSLLPRQRSDRGRTGQSRG
jgi:hypothetical protein